MNDVDQLMTCDAEYFTKYLRDVVYPIMAEHTRASDHVTEICTRHDRGVISPAIVPHSKWTNIDKDENRPGLTLDVLSDDIPPCDVIISTAILHHTAPGSIPNLVYRLCSTASRAVILSGPNVRVIPDLFGDHKYHIDVVEIAKLANDSDFTVGCIEHIGLSEPKCGILLVLVRQ